MKGLLLFLHLSLEPAIDWNNQIPEKDFFLFTLNVDKKPQKNGFTLNASLFYILTCTRLIFRCDDIQNDGDNRWNYTQMVANNKEIMMMTIG